MVSYIWLIVISAGHETRHPGTLIWDLYTGLERFLWARDESYKTMKRPVSPRVMSDERVWRLSAHSDANFS
jgi:hypothetical protein